MAYLIPAAGQARERSRATEASTVFGALPTAAIADVATADADGTYGAPEASLINEIKTKFNTLLAQLRTAGAVTP